MSLWRYGVVYDWDMQLIMDDKEVRTLEQVKQFVDSSQGIEFSGLNLKEKYQWIEEVLKKFKYQWLRRNGKGILRRYMERVTGYSRSQVARLVGLFQVGSGHQLFPRCGMVPQYSFCVSTYRCE